MFDKEYEIEKFTPTTVFKMNLGGISVLTLIENKPCREDEQYLLIDVVYTNLPNSFLTNNKKFLVNRRVNPKKLTDLISWMRESNITFSILEDIEIEEIGNHIYKTF